MSVPEFYRFIRPTLEVHGDGQVRHWSVLEPEIASGLQLPPAHREEMLPSGVRTRVHDRILWALTYLRQAALLESAGRGANKITDRGREYLLRAPQLIRPDDLLQFPEFAAFTQRTSKTPKEAAQSSAHATPDDRMAEAYQEYLTALLDDLLSAIKRMSAEV